VCKICIEFGGRKMLEITTGFMVFWLIWLIGILATLWVIYDVLVNQKKMPGIEKIIWVLVVLLLNLTRPIISGAVLKLIGAVFYYLIVKRERKYES